MNSITETLESLRHVCSIQLYKKNPQHSMFELSGKSKLKQCSTNHNFKIFEERYERATMIIRICRRCGYGDAEVIPPRQKRTSH